MCTRKDIYSPARVYLGFWCLKLFVLCVVKSKATVETRKYMDPLRLEQLTPHIHSIPCCSCFSIFNNCCFSTVFV